MKRKLVLIAALATLALQFTSCSPDSSLGILFNPVWFGIEKHSDYGYTEYKLHWYDAEGGYYEK